MKDHQIRELVNQLRDIAVKYHATGQLREKIARVVRAAMLQTKPDCTCPSGDGSLCWPCPEHHRNSPAHSGLRPEQSGVSPAQDGNSPVIPDGSEQRIAEAVELLKRAAPAMLADDSGPNGPLVGRLKAQVVPGCWCRTCRPVVWNDMRFVVCPDCGNKRCPRANDHRNACSGSNEPGQEGSAYPDAPQEVK